MSDLVFGLRARRYTTKTSGSVNGVSLLVRISKKELDSEGEKIMKETKEIYILLLGFSTCRPPLWYSDQGYWLQN
jgi:hypothetical protein